MRAKFLTSSLFLLLTAACVGGLPTDSRKGEAYRNQPAVFKASYDDVWSAIILAVGGLDWEIRKADKERGEIELFTSYVFNTYFERYDRVFQEPTNEDIENSAVRPYLRRISYYEKITPPQAPPNAKFVKEDLRVEVKSLSPSETEVKINFKIMPYYDYRIGYLGTVKSNGYIETRLFSRINEILHDAGAPPPPPAS